MIRRKLSLLAQIVGACGLLGFFLWRLRHDDQTLYYIGGIIMCLFAGAVLAISIIVTNDLRRTKRYKKK